jgi:hypothetical protein
VTNRTKRFVYVFASSAALSISGCSYNQQSKFQTAFLPSTPHPAAAEIAEPPALEPNPYLSDAQPAPLRQIVQRMPVAPSEADLLMLRADQAFQRGKKAYQANDTQQARREFDAAIDLMLEASEHNPPDRQAFEARLDEMVDAVHRYDLARLGAGADVDEARFEKAPLEDILQMTFPVDPKLKDKVKEQVQATVSQLPLSVNDAVLGYINYFSGRGRKTLIAGLERAGRYRPLIAAHPAGGGRPAGVDPPGAGRIGVFPAGHLVHGRRRNVAVHGVARPGIRADADRLHRRPLRSGEGHARIRQASARSVQYVRRLVPGDGRLQLRAGGRGPRGGAHRICGLLGAAQPPRACPSKPPTMCRSFWP